MSSEFTLRAAMGWLELGLPEDALGELKSLTPTERMLRPALEIRLLAEMESGHWNQGAETGRLLCLHAPKESKFFLHAAYCLHETGDTLAAKDWLMRGPAALQKDPLFHYNLACYLAVLGDRKNARFHLKQAFSMDADLRTSAKEDHDLSCLHSELEGGL
jgi:Flp pilus assembly protein TadD